MSSLIAPLLRCQRGSISRLCRMSMSSSPSVSVENETGIAIVSLNKPPVNSLGLEFMQDIISAIDSVEKEAKGLILTSSNKSIFCAGLDLNEMYKPDETRLRDFWFTLQELWLRMYGCKIPTGAAINGHSPAGGALLATCCDYRAMVASQKATIGLNEAKFGLVAPFWFMDSFRNVLGQREAEFALLNGKLYTVADAKSVGLIDTIVDDKETAIAVCTKIIKDMNKCVPRAWTMTKLAMREAPITRLKSQRREDVDNFVALVMEDGMQKYLDAYMTSLKAAAAKKKSS